jgi:putative ABC transport system permease protein
VFQDVYGMRGAVHEVVIKTASLDDVERVKGELAARMKGFRDLVVKDWSELMPGLMEAIKMDLVSGFIFYIILIVVVAFSILNTFLMVIFERTREFGVMMALGTTPGRLTRILLMESMTMALIGIAVGIGLGIVVTLIFQSKGIVISGASELLSQFGLPERMFPRLSFLSATIGPAVVLVITFFTALYPALKVRRMRTVEALTHG